MNIEAVGIFPFVIFTNTDGKEFCIPRENIIHVETCEDKEKGLDETRTFVNFVNPNSTKDSVLRAIVDMPPSAFREVVLKPAYLPDPDLMERFEKS